MRPGCGRGVSAGAILKADRRGFTSGIPKGGVDVRSFPFKVWLECFAAAALLAWAAAPAAATEWIKLAPERVVESAQLVAVGRFDRPAQGKERGVLADGVLWQLMPFTVDFYVRQPGVLQRLDVGIEPDSISAVAGRRYLVLLEQRQGEWLPVAGPNGLVPLEGDEPALADPDDRQFYLRLLAVEQRYPPFGREQRSRSDVNREVFGALLTVLALGLAVRLMALGGRRARARRP